jgi:hypothetical protein
MIRIISLLRVIIENKKLNAILKWKRKVFENKEIKVEIELEQIKNYDSEEVFISENFNSITNLNNITNKHYSKIIKKNYENIAKSGDNKLIFHENYIFKEKPILEHEIYNISCVIEKETFVGSNKEKENNIKNININDIENNSFKDYSFELNKKISNLAEELEMKIKNISSIPIKDYDDYFDMVDSIIIPKKENKDYKTDSKLKNLVLKSDEYSIICSEFVEEKEIKNNEKGNNINIYINNHNNNYINNIKNPIDIKI